MWQFANFLHPYSPVVLCGYNNFCFDDVILRRVVKQLRLQHLFCYTVIAFVDVLPIVRDFIRLPKYTLDYLKTHFASDILRNRPSPPNDETNETSNYLKSLQREEKGNQLTTGAVHDAVVDSLHLINVLTITTLMDPNLFKKYQRPPKFYWRDANYVLIKKSSFRCITSLTFYSFGG